MIYGLNLQLRDHLKKQQVNTKWEIPESLKVCQFWPLITAHKNIMFDTEYYQNLCSGIYTLPHCLFLSW